MQQVSMQPVEEPEQLEVVSEEEVEAMLKIKAA